jgi:hypothetical protein
MHGQGVWCLSDWITTSSWRIPHTGEQLAGNFPCRDSQTTHLREQKCILGSMRSASYYCLISTKIGMCGQISVKYSNRKFQKNPLSILFLCEDRQTWKTEIGAVLQIYLQMHLKITSIKHHFRNHWFYTLFIPATNYPLLTFHTCLKALNFTCIGNLF